MSSYAFLFAVLGVVVAILCIATFTHFSLTNEQYDRLKWVALHWGVLVVFISLIVKLFDMPYGIETVSLVAGIGALLVGLLDISNAEYKNTQYVMETEDYNENQLMMAEDMLDEDEQRMIKEEI